MNDPIQILTLADANYFLGLRVTALSMAIFAKDPSRLVFNVIDGGIQESQQQDLERSIYSMEAVGGRGAETRAERACR